MSYGEPRTAFALSSVIAIKNRLKNQSYYLGPERDPNAVYNLAGIRLYPRSLRDLAPGVYIVNGKQRIVR